MDEKVIFVRSDKNIDAVSPDKEKAFLKPKTSLSRVFRALVLDASK